MSKIFFEMTPTEANLNHLLNLIEFADYQIATGDYFVPGETKDKDMIYEINNLSADASHHLSKAIEKIIDILGLGMGDPKEELPEEIKVEQEKGHIFMHEVDCADAISHLQGAAVVSMGNIKFDGEDATEIIFKTKDGKSVEPIHTMDALLCSGVHE